MPNYSGMWNLVQQLQATAAGNWPVSTVDYLVVAGGGGGGNGYHGGGGCAGG